MQRKTPPNPFRRFKDRHGLTYSQMAERLGFSEHYARKLGAGMITRISADLALEIERRTRGELRFLDLMRWVYAHHGPRRAA